MIDFNNAPSEEYIHYGWDEKLQFYWFKEKPELITDSFRSNLGISYDYLLVDKSSIRDSQFDAFLTCDWRDSLVSKEISC